MKRNDKKGQIWADPIVQIILGLLLLSVIFLVAGWLLDFVDIIPG